MSDRFIAIVRTVTPTLVAAGLVWLGQRWHYIPDPDVVADLSGVLVAAIAALYYSAVRWLEARWPKLGWLLGVPHAPEYPAAR